VKYPHRHHSLQNRWHTPCFSSFVDWQTTCPSVRAHIASPFARALPHSVIHSGLDVHGEESQSRSHSSHLSVELKGRRVIDWRFAAIRSSSMSAKQCHLVPGNRRAYALAAVALGSCYAAPTFAVEVAAGDWKLTANGNVNVHFINSSCEEQTAAAIVGGLACRGAAGEDRTSSISNGLLPAALAIGASTTQKGYDLAVTFGFYPGISTNDGSPNLQQGADLLNTALGTTAIDMRQVFMTFGNDRMGEFLLGRNIGLFQADAILNDMTLPGVGAGNGNYAAPANTSLGSIGLGYIYTDWLAQINYTTPDFSGFKITVGIFDPLEPILQGTPTPEGSPGFHGKLAYTLGDLYLSASVISQQHEGVTDASDFDSLGFDIGGKFTWNDLEIMAWYYFGEGVGTTAAQPRHRLGHRRRRHRGSSDPPRPRGRPKDDRDAAHDIAPRRRPPRLALASRDRHAGPGVRGRDGTPRPALEHVRRSARVRRRRVPPPGPP
jgi:hypothetical protein